MHQDAITAVLQGDETLATKVIDRDSEADKSFALVGRCFQRTLTDLSEVQRLSHDRSTVFEYYYLCRQLKRIADHVEKIARVTRNCASTPDPTLTDELAELGGKFQDVIEDAANVVLTDTDVSLAYHSLIECDSLARRIEELDESLYDSPELSQAYTGGLLLDSIRRSAEYGANIAALGLQRHYRGMVSSPPR